jgi:hypothetical protein
MFHFLSGDDLKRATEWELFARFCETANLPIVPADVEMLDPPWPDLKAEVNGLSLYFELSEVLQEDWIKAQAQIERTLIAESLLPVLPLIDVRSPLETIVHKKALKRYDSRARPLSLLLYWKLSRPEWTVIEPLVAVHQPRLGATLESSGFDYMWLFVPNLNRIPFSWHRF